jgi:adenylate cyclase
VSGDRPAHPTRLHPDLDLLRSTVQGWEDVTQRQREMLSRMGQSMPHAPASQFLSTLNEIEAALPRWSEAIERLESEWTTLQREQEEGLALYQVSQVVNSTLDLETVLNQVMDHIIKLTGAERGFLMLKDQDSEEMDFKVARNMDRETLSGSSFEISLTIVNNVAQDGQPIVTTNAQADPRFALQESVVAYSLRSILCVPLRVRDKVTGVIYADNRIRTGLFTERDRDLLATFANQAATAIANAQLYERVRNMKNLMDNVFASITSGVITTDVTDKIMLFNRASESILGVLADDVMGCSYRQALPLDKRFASLVEGVKRHEQAAVGHELTPHLPQRGQVNLSVSVSPLKDEQATTLGVAIVMEDQTETRRLEAQLEAFRRTVSPSVYSALAANPDRWKKLGGDRREITVLFADIRNFTSYAEKLPPEHLINALNQYLALGANAVLSEDGTLDKFMGDMVMAFFNAPLSQPDHVLRAARAALNMRAAIDRFNRDQPEAEKLWFGIGISSGIAVVGMIGTERKVDYTAVGDVVNYGKRLQENARAGQILLSQVAYERIRDQVVARALEPIQVKHRVAVEPVYELDGLR